MSPQKSKALPDIPGVPHEGDEPVFAAPWRAQAFALAVSLNEAGHFTWAEWTERFAPILKEAQIAPGASAADVNETYYQAWLKALERLVVEKGILTAPALTGRAHCSRSRKPAELEKHPLLLRSGAVKPARVSKHGLVAAETCSPSFNCSSR